MKTYTREETIEELKKGLSNISNLYNAKCVNWSGKTKDTEEFYSEIIANELLRELKEFDKIPSVTRNQTYIRENHCNVEIDICKSNRNEENYAKRLTGLKLEGLGLIKDYQIPLKDTNENIGLGKIDLISFNEENNTLYLIELKYLDNNETLLRASLESYTYYKIVDEKKLKNDCLSNQHFILNKIFNNIDPNNIKVKPAVLVVPGCKAYEELNEVNLDERPKLRTLLLALEMNLFTIEFYVDEIDL